MPCDKHFSICLLVLYPEGYVELFLLHTLPLDAQIVFGDSQNGTLLLSLPFTAEQLWSLLICSLACNHVLLGSNLIRSCGKARSKQVSAFKRKLSREKKKLQKYICSSSIRSSISGLQRAFVLLYILLIVFKTSLCDCFIIPGALLQGLK